MRKAFYRLRATIGEHNVEAQITDLELLQAEHPIAFIEDRLTALLQEAVIMADKRPRLSAMYISADRIIREWASYIKKYPPGLYPPGSGAHSENLPIEKMVLEYIAEYT